MSSNLPPGVTESMLPGNRPEDIEWEQLMEWVGDQYDGMSADDIRRAVLIGIDAVQADAEVISDMIQDAKAEGASAGYENGLLAGGFKP